MSDRTIQQIGERYDAKRNRILETIRAGGGASLSGIENYPKPWALLDMADPYDASIISCELVWDDEAERRTHDGLRPLTDEELQLWKQHNDAFYAPSSPERTSKIAAIRREIFAAEDRANLRAELTRP